MRMKQKKIEEVILKYPKVDENVNLYMDPMSFRKHKYKEGPHC